MGQSANVRNVVVSGIADIGLVTSIAAMPVRCQERLLFKSSVRDLPFRFVEHGGRWPSPRHAKHPALLVPVEGQIHGKDFVRANAS
jgi:hypothetical protein